MTSESLERNFETRIRGEAGLSIYVQELNSSVEVNDHSERP